jgi:hypothetical protein
MKVISSYIFEPGDKLYYVDKEGSVFNIELTENILGISEDRNPSLIGDENYVFKPYEPVRIYDNYGRLYLWKKESRWVGRGMGAGPETRYINEVANVFINEKRAFHYAEIVKKKNKEKEFFKSYSEIQIKHAKSDRLLNSLSFTPYSLTELLKLNNLYNQEGTPIKVVVIDNEGKEYDYLEIQKELEKFI